MAGGSGCIDELSCVNGQNWAVDEGCASIVDNSVGHTTEQRSSKEGLPRLSSTAAGKIAVE